MLVLVDAGDSFFGLFLFFFFTTFAAEAIEDTPERDPQKRKDGWLYFDSFFFLRRRRRGVLYDVSIEKRVYLQCNTRIRDEGISEPTAARTILLCLSASRHSFVSV